MVADQLKGVRERIDRAAVSAGRDPGEIVLVAVAKGRTDDEVLAAYEAGHRDFGENRDHELLAHAAAVPADTRWHFIGTLQRRKIGSVVAHADLLHTLDRESLVVALAKREAPPPVLIEVNLAAEPRKHGYPVAEVAAARTSAEQAGLEVRGLMAIPPMPERPEDSRPWFEQLRSLRDELWRDRPEPGELSMGMTDDFEVAVACGATLVRVGRAIFGERTTAPATAPR
jgi:pyridoxal phosphate enzyme (YggS family)